MVFIFNKPSFKDRRRELRKNSTDSEQLLWSRLRAKQISDFKFFRQYSVGSYILDFYCPEKKLAIEIDGSQHLEPGRRAYDEERTNFLEEHDIKVIRFWSNDVIRNLNGVMEAIFSVLTPPTSS